MIFIKLFLALYLVFCNSGAFAHGDVHQQIYELTTQIDLQPTNLQLFRNRGQLYVDDQDWLSAQKDFNAVRELDSTFAEVDLLEAKMWFAANRLGLSYPLVDRYLQHNPDVPVALALRAKVSLMLGRADSSVNDYARVIELSDKVLPDMYLQWAKAQAKVVPMNRQQIHQIIQLGLDKFGSLVVLLQYVIDFDRQQKAYLSALMGIKKLPQQLRQHPFWLVQKAELLALLNKHLEAKVQYQVAYDRLQKKKQSGRFNKADQKLLETIIQSLHLEKKENDNQL